PSAGPREALKARMRVALRGLRCNALLDAVRTLLDRLRGRRKTALSLFLPTHSSGTGKPGHVSLLGLVPMNVSHSDMDRFLFNFSHAVLRRSSGINCHRWSVVPPTLTASDTASSVSGT